MIPLLAPLADDGAVFLLATMPPEVVFTLAELSLIAAVAYATWRLLLRVVDALSGSGPGTRPEDR